MAAKKETEAPRKRGRPKGSGLGLDVQIGLRVTPEVAEVIDEAAAEDGSDRATVARQVVTRWAERRKGKGKR